MSNQKWKNEKTFSSYKEALEYKTLLQHSPEGAILEFKIKSYKEDCYIVKSRVNPELVDVIKKLEEEIAANKLKTKKG